MSKGKSLYNPAYVQPTMTPAPPRPPYKEKFNFNISCQVPKKFKDVNHKVSIAWKFFQIDEDQQIGKCNFCGMLYAVKNWTTSSLLRHLRRSHKKQLEKAIQKQEYLKNLSRAEYAKIKSKYYKPQTGEEVDQNESVVQTKPEWQNLKPPIQQKKLLVEEFHEKKKILNEIFSRNPILAHYINSFPLYASPHQILLTLRKTNQFQLMEIRQGFNECYWARMQNCIPELFVRLDKNIHIHQMIPNLVNRGLEVSSITIITSKMNENYQKYGKHKPISFLYCSKLIKNSPMKINVTNATYYSSSHYHPLPKNFYSNGGTQIITYKQLQGVIYIVGQQPNKNQPIILGIVIVFDCFYISPFLKASKRQQKVLIEDDYEGCAAIFKNYLESLIEQKSPNNHKQSSISLPTSIVIDAPPIFHQGFKIAAQQFQIDCLKKCKSSMKKNHPKRNSQYISISEEQEEESYDENEEDFQLAEDPNDITKIMFQDCSIKYLCINEMLLDSTDDKESLEEKIIFVVCGKLRETIQKYNRLHKFQEKEEEKLLNGLFSMINGPFLETLIAKTYGIVPTYLVEDTQGAPILANFLFQLFKNQSLSIPSLSSKRSLSTLNKLKKQFARISTFSKVLMASEKSKNIYSQIQKTMLLIESIRYLWISCNISGSIETVLRSLIEKLPWKVYEKLMYIWMYCGERLETMLGQQRNISVEESESFQQNKKLNFIVFEKSSSLPLTMVRKFTEKSLLSGEGHFLNDSQEQIVKQQIQEGQYKQRESENKPNKDIIAAILKDPKTKKIKKQMTLKKIKQKMKNDDHLENSDQDSQNSSFSNHRQQAIQSFEVVYHSKSRQSQLQCTCGLIELLGLPCPHALCCLDFMSKNNSIIQQIIISQLTDQHLRSILLSLFNPTMLAETGLNSMIAQESITESVIMGILQADIGDMVERFDRQSLNYLNISKSSKASMKRIGFEGLLKLLLM